MMADQAAGAPPMEPLPQAEEDRDRFEEFKTNPVRSAATDPVSTFSIDVDTASYSLVRRSLKEGFPAASRHGARRGDDQLLPLRLEGS